MRLNQLCALFVFFVGSIAWPVSATVSGAERIAAVEGITEYRLSNGLRLLLYAQAAKTTTAVDVTYLAGTRQERAGEIGTAKLAARLANKATLKTPSIAQEFARRGMRTTHFVRQDFTHFSNAFRASDEQLEWLLQTEADRMTNAVFTQKDIETEGAAVLADYQETLKKQTVRLAGDIEQLKYAWHNAGAAHAQEQTEIARVPLESVRTFYRTWYQPDNAVVLIAGKFDETNALALAVKYLGAVPKPARIMPPPPADVVYAPADGKRVNERSIIASYRSPPALDANAPALEFAATLLFERGLTQKYKGTYSGFAAELAKDGGLLIFGTTLGLSPKSPEQTSAETAAIRKQLDERLVTSAEERQRALDAYYANERVQQYAHTEMELVERIEGLAATPPTSTEMERVRQRKINAFRQAMDNHEKLGAELAESIGLGDWRLFFYSRDRVKNMTVSEIVSASGKYLRKENRIASVSRVAKTDSASRPAAPTAAEVLQYFKAPAAATTAAATVATEATVGVARAYNADSVEIDRQVKKIRVAGLNVSLLNKPNANQTTAISLVLQSGDEKSLFGKATVADVAGRLLERGTTKFQYGIQDERSKLGLRGEFANRSANFQTTRPYAGAAIRLIGHAMREATFPDFAGKNLVERMLDDIRAQKNNAAGAATNAMQRHFNQFPAGDFRNIRSFEEQEEALKTLKLTDLREFHKQFYGAAAGDVAIVGDFDENEIVAALHEAFADWTTGIPYARLAMPYKDVAAVTRAIEIPGSESAFFAARLNINMQDSDPDYAALLVADYIVGGKPGFRSRLASRLRLQEGVSYSVRSELDVSSTDRGSAWSVYAFTDAPQIAKTESVFRDELQRATRGGFTAAEVAAAKAAVLHMRREQRTRENALAGQLILNSQSNRTFARSKQLEDRIAHLRVDEVSAAFRKHIVPGKISVFKAGDFSSVAATSSAALAK
jgi:zinc protease